MNSPSLGTYALSFLLAGVGGWAVSQSLQHDSSVTPTAAVAPANPTPIKVTIVTPGSGQSATTGRAAPQQTGTGARTNPARAGSATGTVRRAHAASRCSPRPARSELHRNRAAAPSRRTPVSPVRPAPARPSVLKSGGGTNIIASNGAIVYMGDNGHLIANTGATSSSGVVALGVSGSDLGSGDSQQSTHGSSAAAPAQSAASTAGASNANGSFASIGAAAGGYTSVAVSGFEDHSVSVIGDDQITTYDDSNVFINRDGNINANTGDTDSSGLNAVDVTGSVVRAGNSGDGEGGDGEDSDDDDAAPAPAPATAGSPAVGDETSASSDEQDGDEAEDSSTTAAAPGSSSASVTDEGASSATGDHSMVVGADGYDDVSIRTHGNRDITSYDDSNVVIGGQGNVNAQIGDSDTGGAVVMGIHNSDVRAGCEGDLCYSGSHR